MLLHLEHDRRSVAFARRWVVRQAHALGVRGETQAAVELLTSELVANAINHGPDDGVITVRTSADGDLFEVAVSDEGTGRPVLRHPPPTAEGGRGVMLVDLLAHTWGTRDLAGGGKAIWFTVEL